jgi:chaperonin GroEL
MKREFNKEVLLKEGYYELLIETIQEVGEAVTCTLGPDGSTVIIKDYNGNSYITKDGVSVLNAISFVNSQKKVITDIIKEVAEKTVNEAGDGTTTSLLFCSFFILESIKLLREGESIREVRKELEKLERIILTEIQLKSKQIKEDKESFIKKITNVSSNGDSSIVDLVLEAYKYSDNIKIVEDINLKDSIEKEDGYIIERKNKSINFNIEDGVYNNLFTIIVNDKFTSFPKEITKEITKNKDKNILIIAHSFNNHIIEKVNLFNKGNNKIILIEAPGMSDFKRLLLEDLIEYLDINKSDKFYIGGTAQKVKVDFNKITLFGTPNKRIKARIKRLKSSIEKANDEVSQTTLKSRLEKLTDKTVTIRVGGNSNIESRERKDRVEDAVLAVNCALDEGYLPGGGQFLKHLYNKYQYLMFSEIFLLPSKKLEENGTDLSKIDTDDIIDPSKVLKTALKNSISVAKTLVSSGALITSPYDIQNK